MYDNSKDREILRKGLGKNLITEKDREEMRRKLASGEMVIISDDDLSSEYDQPESIIERIEDLQEKRTSLTKVWMQLTDAEQELLYRKYVLDQTTKELAGIFQCSRDSIRMRLSRVRRKSLRLMKGEGTNDETRTTAGKL